MFSQDAWTEKADFPGAERVGAFAFAIGTKGYLGGGGSMLGDTLYKDFWEYDTVTDAWTQLADYGGQEVINAIGFSNSFFGWVGLGCDTSGVRSDMWRYSPWSNAWTVVTSFIGEARQNAVAFSIGNYTYVGLGENDSILTDNAFYRYDEANDLWTSISGFPGQERRKASAFAANSKGYVLGGIGLDDQTNSALTDFWEYSPITDTWSQKADFIEERISPAVFSVNNYGYVIGGLNAGVRNDGYLFDYESDTWRKLSNVELNGRYEGRTFVINNKAYIIGGGVGFDLYVNDNWELDASSHAIIGKLSNLDFACTGSTFLIPYTSIGNFNIGNTFSVQLSDALGAFENYTVIGTHSSTSSGTISITIPSGIELGDNYRMRIVSSNPYTVGCDNGENIKIRASISELSNFGAGMRHSAGAFTIGDKVYIAGGLSHYTTSLGRTDDLWEYNPATDSWTQKTSLGTYMFDPVSFELDGLGYIIEGTSMWAYNPATNSWASKASVPEIFNASLGFTIEGKAYVGTGASFSKNFYVYNPLTDTWSGIAEFPGAGRYSASAFTIGTKGYVGLGITSSGDVSDFYSYDPIEDKWSIIRDFPVANSGAASYSIGAKGFVALGQNNARVYSYNADKDEWFEEFKFEKRRNSTAFVYNNEAYLLGGFDSTGLLLNKVHKFIQCSSGGISCGAYTIVTNPLPTSLAAGDSVEVAYQAGCFSNPDNTFFVELSDVSGSFKYPFLLGFKKTTASGTIKVKIPEGILPGKKYRIRVSSNYPRVKGVDNKEDIVIVTGSHALRFDGVDDRVRISGNSAYNFGSGDFTIEAWMKLASPTGSTNRPIISNRKAGATANSFMFMIYNSRYLLLQINNINLLSNQVPSSLFDDECHHVAVTRTGTDVNFYLDGVNIGTVINTHSISSLNDVYIGYDPVDNRSVKGEIHDVRLWNISRTSLDILNDANSYLNGNELGLAGYWPLSEYSGQTVLDGSIYKNSGILGIDTTNSFDPVHINGRCYSPVLNAGLYFDGVDDKAYVYEKVFNYGSGDFTMESWIKIPPGSSDRPILSSRTNTSNGFLFRTFSGGTQLLLQLNGTPNHLSTTFPSIFDGQCHHIAVARSGNTLTFYLDGVAKGTATSNRSNNTPGKLHFGYDLPDNSSLKGNINEVRMWYIGRGGSDIQYGLDKILERQTPGLNGYFLFNEPFGQKVINDAFDYHAYLGEDSVYTDSKDPIRVSSECFSGDRRDIENIPYVPNMIDDTTNYVVATMVNHQNIFSVSPNPSKEVFALSIMKDFAEELIFEVFDFAGRLVESGKIAHNSKATLGEDLIPGIYVLVLKSENHFYTQKIIKQ